MSQRALKIPRQHMHPKFKTLRKALQDKHPRGRYVGFCLIGHYAPFKCLLQDPCAHSNSQIFSRGAGESK